MYEKFIYSNKLLQSRSYFFLAKDNPGHSSRYLQCATARNQRRHITSWTIKSHAETNLISYHLHLILPETDDKFEWNPDQNFTTSGENSEEKCFFNSAAPWCVARSWKMYNIKMRDATNTHLIRPCWNLKKHNRIFGRVCVRRSFARGSTLIFNGRAQAKLSLHQTPENLSENTTRTYLRTHYGRNTVAHVRARGQFE